MRSSSGSDYQNGDVNGFPLKPNKLFMQEVNFLCFPVFLLIEKRRLNGFSDDFVEF